MRSFLFFLALVISTQSLFGQCDTNRYVNPIFDSVYKHSNVKYGESPVWTIPYNNTDLFMDIYEPIGDDLTKRPLMVWVHPGGFLLGNNEAEDMVALCDSFSKRGYVTASVGYRLGFNPLSSSSAERAVYRGTQDVRSALRYLIEFADVFDIDTNYIFLGGSSAGGVATLHAAYTDQDEVPSSAQGGIFGNDLGCIDCSGNSYDHEISLSGIVNLWGALGDSSWIDADETTPALLIHGVDDGVVPFGVGHPFGVITTPLTHGSRSVHNQLDFHGIEHNYMPFEGQDHEPPGPSHGDFNGAPTPYWDTIFNAVRDHYFTQLKPNSAMILGSDIVCDQDIVWYSVDLSNEESACWTVQNGSIIEDFSDSIQVQWSEGIGYVSARVFNESGASSDQYSISVEVKELPIADFTFEVNGATVSFESSNSNALEINWDFGDDVAGIGQFTNHSYPADGNYTVAMEVIGTNGCINQQTNTVTVNEGKIFFEMYPNPAESEINLIKVPKGSKVIITDAIGKRMKRMKASETTILLNILNYRAGVYFVTVVYNGDRVTKRFVKK